MGFGVGRGARGINTEWAIQGKAAWDAANSLAANVTHSVCKGQTPTHAGVWLSPSPAKADVKPCRGGCPPRATSQTPAGPHGSDEGGREKQWQEFPLIAASKFSLLQWKRWGVLAQGLPRGGRARTLGTITVSQNFWKAKQLHITARMQRLRCRVCLGLSSGLGFPLLVISSSSSTSSYQTTLYPHLLASLGFPPVPDAPPPAQRRRILVARAEPRSALRPFPRSTPKSCSAPAAPVPPPLCLRSPHGAANRNKNSLGSTA